MAELWALKDGLDRGSQKIILEWTRILEVLTKSRRDKRILFNKKKYT